MNFLRQKPYFAYLALFLGVCFAFFAFQTLEHSYEHIGHESCEAGEKCVFCQIVAHIFFFLALLFCLVILAEKTPLFFFQNLPFSKDLNRNTILRRGPPISFC